MSRSLAKFVVRVDDGQPQTEAGRRLLRMFRTEERPRGRRWPYAFDARLAERIVEELVPLIEREAADAAVSDR